MLRLSMLYALLSTAACVQFTDEPRLETVDGNLFIVAARDRNVTLATSGRGAVTVNGYDVRGAVEAAQGAARAANARASGFAALQADVRRLIVDQALLRDRLAACEARFSNTSVVPVPGGSSFSPALSLQALTSRLGLLERNLRKNECVRNPCRHGGKCLDLYLKFSCTCLDGWEGDRCQKDTNECATLAGTDLGCQNGATCINRPGTYECQCRPGFYGRHCTKRTNDCSAGSSAELCDHGTCVSLEGAAAGFKCICDQGWTKAVGLQACSVDVDECLTAPCSRVPKVNCINIPGSFRCESCPPGYTGNGHSCDNVNECAISNGGCSVAPLVACIDTPGSVRCGPCPPGYVGDGTTCTYVGRCRADNGGCHPQATCQEMGPSVVCTCQPGYAGSGIGLYGCVPSGAAPSSTHPCASNPCLNGRCVPTSSFNYTCDCYMGFSGSRCQLARNPCDSSPCENGGTCLPRGNSFRCRCTKLYTGTRCTTERQNCGGFLGSDDGVLEFPSTSSSSYLPNLSCAWRIRVNTSLVVRTTFEAFDLEPPANGECTADWLQIYDGKDIGNHNMMGKFCGNQMLNRTLLSTSNNLLLWFKSNRISNHMGFKLRWNSTAPVCGGQLNARVHGTFSSPGSPGVYPPGRDCYWLATTAIGQRITFTFFQLSIETHSNCDYDYIEFFDGGSTDSPLIQRHCTSGTPPPLVTPGNVAYVHFHSDNKSQDLGFQISFNPTPGVPGCGGIFTDRRGEIQSVGADGKYKENMDCVWLVRAQPGQRIKLSFLSLDLEDSTGCIHDFLEVRQGADITAPLAGKFCGRDGNSTPNPIISQSSSLYIRFRTDSSLNFRGFRLKYEDICDRTFVEPSGIVMSPSYPKKYPDGLDCSYLIDQPPGKSIILEFQDFDIENGNAMCYLDYLEVYDGMDNKAPSRGRYCGRTRPNTIVSTQNKLFLKFRTDSSISYTGWAANYSTIDTNCGGVYTSPTGTISSPSSKEGYPPNTVCHWVIQGPPGTHVELTFRRFHLENPTVFEECTFDYLAVSDTVTYRGEPAGDVVKFCGNKIPPPLTSSKSIVYLRFSTDSTRAGDGFEINYSFVNASTMCGGNFFARSGVLKSPHYPSSYPNDKLCNWLIKVPEGQQIRLMTSAFRTEFSSDCGFDHLEIYNGGSAHSPLIGKYCGSKGPPLITSFSNTLFLRFFTDALATGPGFYMVWDGSLTGCGGLLTSDAGSIISPNYPEPYGHNAQCYYRIRTAMGSRVSLLFVDVQLEDDDENCSSDWLEVFDGPDAKARSLGRRCRSSRTVDSILSSSNQLFIKFNSDAGISGKGFHITYRTQCNVTISGQRGVIESPNYPDAFQPGTACAWTITVDEGHTVNMTFTDFSFADSDCNTSYVHIKQKELNGAASSELGKYCDTRPPPVLISSALGIVEIFLVASGSDDTGAFRIEWTSVGCGGTLTKPSGTFTSPNYPAHYPARTRCVWHIALDEDHSVKLTVGDIGIEPSRECRLDALEVYGGGDLTSPRLARDCSMESPPKSMEVESSGNLMTVVFTSDLSQTGKGFSASYTSIPLKCGGVLKSMSGSIHSRNYPKNFQPLDDCLWTVRVDAQHRVNLTFIDFDLPNVRDANCTDTYVQVFDGDSQEAPSLLKACGNRLPDVSTVISSSEVITVRMRSGSQYSSKGFLANFSMTCGAIITATEPGTITLNNGITVLDHFEHCSWTLLAPQPDGHITATLAVLEMAPMDFLDNPCEPSSVEIFDGDSSNSSRLGLICGFSTPLPYVSTGNSLFISYKKIWSFQNSLQIAYSAVSSACGGDLFNMMGSFASPGYPGSYPPNVECIWTIHSSPGNGLQMHWKQFSLTASPFCTVDYVEVRRGSATGQLLNSFCGDAAPSNLTSDSGFWVKFSSGANGGSGANLAFLAEYSMVTTNELRGPSGQIANPLYPRPFRGSLTQDVSYRVTVSMGKRIRFNFTELQVDPKCFSEIMIFDGYDDTATAKPVCGFVPPAPIYSSSNVAFVKVEGDLYIGVKFKLFWDEIALATVVTTRNITSDCGGELSLNPSLQSLTIKSPNHPGNYPKQTRCEWVVRAPPGYHLGYRFNSITLNPSRGCVFDYVVTYDGDEKTEKGRYCLRNETTDQHVAVEVGQVLRVVFQSSFLPGKPGFQLQVDLDQGGVFEMSDGIIDFGWNGSVWRFWIQVKQFHEWTVRVSKGRQIKLTFEEFDVAAALDGTCKEKYLMLRNGNHADSPFLGEGKYCGAVPVNIPLTSGENLYVKISTPWRTSRFRLRFEEVSHACGGRLTLTENLRSLTFSTPNYPNSPHPKIQCVWIVQAPPGKTVQIDFVDRFDIATTDEECSGEYVELRDGGSLLAPELGRYCQEAPSTLSTSDNLLYVKYFTNVTDPNNGFSAQVSLEKCGGVLRSSQGVLRSPDYPNLQSNLDCLWTIQTGAYQQLVLSFVDWNMPPSRSNSPSFRTMTHNDWRRWFWVRSRSNCTSANTLLVYESTPPLPSPPPDATTEPYSIFLRMKPEQEEILGVFCAKSSPVAITSAGNAVHIRLTTGMVPPNFRGFKLNFTSIDTECGGSFGTPDGIIATPHYPREIPRPYHCRWSVRVPPGRRITVTFLDFDLTGNHMEQRLYLFEDAVRMEVAMLHKLKPPLAEYKTSGNTLIVVFHSVAFSGTAHRGFQIRYSSNEAAVCGGYMNQTEGVIEPPTNQTSFYCEWIFPDRRLGNGSLVFALEDAHLGNMSRHSCSIHNSVGLFIAVDNDLEKFKMELCGDVPNQVLASPFGNIKVKSAQTKPYSPVTFRLRYRWSDCGGFITSDMLPYTLTTPGYPGGYPPNSDCAWRVQTEPGQTIKMTFELLELEVTCRDYVSVYNGGGPSAPQIDTFCGSAQPKPIVSQTEALFIQFHSDASSQGRGFQIKLETNHSTCGGMIFDEGVELMSPEFPQKYGPDIECEWEIRSIPGTHIGLVFTDRFYLEESVGCANDFIKVYDFIKGRWELISTLCGRTIPVAVNSTSPRMRVLFRTNHAVSGDGFRARWTRNCGGELDGVSGVITSPGYPDIYPRLQHCEYFIRGRGQLLTVNFTMFRLEKSGGVCRYDYVELEEMSTSVTSHGRYCGVDMPRPLSVSHDLKVTFHSDGYANFAGFVLEYSVERCGGPVTASGVLQYSLPFSPSSHPGDCVWDITAPADMVIAVTLTNVSLPSNNQCSYLSLALREPAARPGGNATTLARVCGNPNATLPFTSNSNLLQLVLHRKYAWVPQSFFTAYISFTYGESQGCGGRLVVGDNPETLSSPDVNRDGRYEEFLECQWQIEAVEGRYLTAKVLTIDLDACNSTDCSCDFIEIRDGMGPYSDLLLKACGSRAPDVIASSSNRLWLRLSTDGSYSGRGFTVQFSSQLSPCGHQRLTATREVQMLTSPGYPLNYPVGMRCSWMIVPPGNSTGWQRQPIHIHIVSWDIEDSEDCNNDFLGIEDYGNREFKIVPDRNRDLGSGGMIYHGRSDKRQIISYAQRRLIGNTRYCGQGGGVDFYATSGEAVLQLVSNSAVTGKGFQIEYSLSPCSRNYTRKQGRIRNSRFQPGEECVIRIEAPSANHTISLYFSSFAMPADCSKSYLQVRDGADASAVSLAKVCGYTTPKPIFSTGSRLYLTMYTAIPGYTDVDITYTTTDQGPGCGGELYNYGGIFTSPQYPQYVRKNAVCQWDVSVPEGLVIAFKFTVFDLGPASTCATDYIEFFEQNPNTGVSSLRTRYCGGDEMSSILGVSESMTVKYTRSVHNGGTGWSLIFAGVVPGYEVGNW